MADAAVGAGSGVDVLATTTLRRLAAAVPEIDSANCARRSTGSAHRATVNCTACSPIHAAAVSARAGQWTERRGWRNEIDSDALALLSQPMVTLADSILARLHRKALRRGAFPATRHRPQHDLRIDLKKLRYGDGVFPAALRRADVRQAIRRAAGQAAGEPSARA